MSAIRQLKISARSIYGLYDPSCRVPEFPAAPETGANPVPCFPYLKFPAFRVSGDETNYAKPSIDGSEDHTEHSRRGQRAFSPEIESRRARNQMHEVMSHTQVRARHTVSKEPDYSDQYEHDAYNVCYRFRHKVSFQTYRVENRDGVTEKIKKLLLCVEHCRNTIRQHIVPARFLFNGREVSMKRILIIWTAILFTASVFSGCDMAKPSGQIEQSSMVVAANETAAISRLRSIATAEMNYQAQSGGEYGTLDQLVEKGFMGDPSKGKLTGYRFEVKVRMGNFQATAIPERVGLTGIRSFYVDQSRIVRGADKKGEAATESDPEV